jgi:hypothetical protein
MAEASRRWLTQHLGEEPSGHRLEVGQSCRRPRRLRNDCQLGRDAAGFNMTKRLDVLEQDGWPARTILLGSVDTLGDVVNHVRNAVAHRRLQFSSESPHLSEVDIEFADAKTKALQPTGEQRRGLH